MSKVSDADVQIAGQTFIDRPSHKSEDFWDNMRAALEAVSSIHEAEPVAWRWKWGVEGAWHYGPSRPSFDDPRSPYFGKLDVVEPLYAHPAPISKGVTVKALEWVQSRVFGFTKWRGTFPGFGELYSFNGDDMTTEEVAAQKAVHQAAFDARIRSCLSHTAGKKDPTP